MLNARCTIDLDDAGGVVSRLRKVYGEFGEPEDLGTRLAIGFSYGRMILDPAPGRLEIEAMSGDETGLAYVKMGLAHNIRDQVKPFEPRIVWTGDGTGPALPYFREMRVEEVLDLTPHMRRLVLSGRDLARFAVGGLHVRLVFPPKGRAPVWPHMGEDGCPAWPAGEDGLIARVYTIRHIDVGAGRVTIDMLRHDGDATPGAGFAAGARPGDVVGLAGPSGSGVPEARSVILVGDETALPAIARILEALPAEAEARVFVEVENAAEEQALSCAARTEVTWLRRDAPDWRPGSLSALVEGLDPEALPDDTYLFAGCEFSDFKAIRRCVRAKWGWKRERHSVAAYWRRGLAGDEARSAD